MSPKWRIIDDLRGQQYPVSDSRRQGCLKNVTIVVIAVSLLMTTAIFSGLRSQVTTLSEDAHFAYAQTSPDFNFGGQVIGLMELLRRAQQII